MKHIFLLLLMTLLMFSKTERSVETSDRLKIPNDDFKTWDPEGGVISSLSAKAQIFASSNQATATAVLDGNAQTHWISGPPLPNDFIKRPDLNILLGSARSATLQYSGGSNLEFATDGNINSAATISKKGNNAWISFDLGSSTSLSFLALRATQFSAPIEIRATMYDGKTQEIGSYLPSDYGHLTRLPANLLSVKAIELSSTADFQVFELAALAGPPKEYVTIDLGQPQIVGWIDSRHWAGSNTATATTLLMSADNKRWYKIANLDPNALHSVSTLVSPPVKARYIRLSHTLVPNDWNKVLLWKLVAYDEHGPFGKMPAAQANPHSFRALLGVNAIWGWGRNKYADLQAKGEAAERYAAVASHARNYHFVKWEVNDPDHTPDYTAMAEGKGTEANDWLNWDREYRAWQEAGMKVHTAVKFGEIDGKLWDHPYESAYKYGQAFARHFGPTYGNGLVDVMEIGNEPWYYEAGLYRDILRGMAKGVKDIDPDMFVLPCALHAAWPQNETEGLFKNYMGARITAAEAPYLDGLNIHYYSWFHQPNGTRIAVHPEHPGTEMRAILNDIRFRDTNMPGKPIFLTEWGWESPGGGQDCTHPECVSETASAYYAIRGMLMFARLGIARLGWFFYANEGPSSSLFTRSGLTSTPETGFKKKQVFFALEAFMEKFGNTRFLEVLREDKTAWIYLLGNEKGVPTHLIAWRPVSAEEQQMLPIKLAFNKKPKFAWRFVEEKRGIAAESLPLVNESNWMIKISSAPLVVEISR